MASGASNVNIGEEMHFDFVDTIALASFAAPAFDVKGESTCLVATDFGFWLSGEKVANGGEDSSVGGRVATRSAANGRLIDNYDFVEVL